MPKLEFRVSDWNNDDEIVGLWENYLDDGSGIQIIYGWAIQFNEDGSGFHVDWDSQKRSEEELFSWLRIGEKSIQIKYREEEEWTTIHYELEIVDAPYSGKLKKLTEPAYKTSESGSEGFFLFYGAMFKRL